MINLDNARKYCCDDISLIENYDKASKDLIQTWHLHHRMEDEGYSVQELKDMGMYYCRPASELIFLTRKEHVSLHHKGKNLSKEHRMKISEAKKGDKHPMYGKKHTEESRRKMSEVHKGEKNPMYCKHHSEEAKRKMSEALKGEKHPMYGKHRSEETRRKISEAKKGKTGEKHNCSKPVNQIDKKTGQVIKTWPCTMEVQRVLGIASQNISACCLCKQKSAGGYIWRYK